MIANLVERQNQDHKQQRRSRDSDRNSADLLHAERFGPKGARVSGLFRPEALNSQRETFLGTIRIARNPSFALVASVAVLCASALVTFAIWGEVTRKARFVGVLVPVLGNLPLTAGSSGVLLETRMREGDLVQAGQPLFVLGTDRTTAAGVTAELVAHSLASRRAALQSERAARELQMRQREQALADRLHSTETELAQAENEAQLAERRVQLGATTLQRYQQLAREGFVAELQVQQRQEELIDLQGRAGAAERYRTTLQRDIRAMRVEQGSIRSQQQADLAQLDRSLAVLDQESTENDSRRSLVVVAPQGGTITALNVHVGQALQAGQTLATFVPQAENGQPSELHAQLFAPSRTAGFVQPGQQVWLRYAAYPYQKFGMHGGRITGVSRTPINAQDLPAGQATALLSAAQSNEPLYRIDVQLNAQTVATYGQTQLLKPGMALEADVMQDRRAVWEWMLEPVIAARARAQVLGVNPVQVSPGG